MDDVKLAKATGMALALFGSLLEAGRILPRGETGRHLANLAAVTGETKPDEAAILQRWADLLNDAHPTKNMCGLGCTEASNIFSAPPESVAECPNDR